MMRTTRMLALAGVTALSISLVACSAPGGEEDGKVTLTYWKLADTNDASKQASKEIIEGFQKAHPDIKIDVQERATDAHKEALRTSLGTSAAPDVMSVVPVVIVYLLFQRYFVSGAFAGSVKG